MRLKRKMICVLRLQRRVLWNVGLKRKLPPTSCALGASEALNIAIADYFVKIFVTQT